MVTILDSAAVVNTITESFMYSTGVEQQNFRVGLSFLLCGQSCSSWRVLSLSLRVWGLHLSYRLFVAFLPSPYRAVLDRCCFVCSFCLPVAWLRQVLVAACRIQFPDQGLNHRPPALGMCKSQPLDIGEVPGWLFFTYQFHQVIFF